MLNCVRAILSACVINDLPIIRACESKTAYSWYRLKLGSDFVVTPKIWPAELLAIARTLKSLEVKSFVLLDSAEPSAAYARKSSG